MIHGKYAPLVALAHVAPRYDSGRGKATGNACLNAALRLRQASGLSQKTLAEILQANIGYRATKKHKFLYRFDSIRLTASEERNGGVDY